MPFLFAITTFADESMNKRKEHWNSFTLTNGTSAPSGGKSLAYSNGGGGGGVFGLTGSGGTSGAAGSAAASAGAPSAGTIGFPFSSSAGANWFHQNQSKKISILSIKCKSISTEHIEGNWNEFHVIEWMWCE